LFYFRALAANKARSYRYTASVNETSARVVSIYANKKKPDAQGSHFFGNREIRLPRSNTNFSSGIESSASSNRWLVAQPRTRKALKQFLCTLFEESLGPTIDELSVTVHAKGTEAHVGFDALHIDHRQIIN
jgi:hypothetical protein